MSSAASPSPSGNTAALQERLIAFLGEISSGAGAVIGVDTRIFEISLFDSLALVELVGWVETEMGGVVDLSDVDFRTEWATVGDIVRYIERGGGGS